MILIGKSPGTEITVEKVQKGGKGVNLRSLPQVPSYG